jgi:NAD(P)-dependent dehydrogenase (short-subunit alcohol dehydrogenase family)
MNNMNGKICLVTGATNGIGEETALALARMGARVIIVGRNPAKGAAVVDKIKAQSKNDAVELMTADLSLMSEVRRLADQFKAQYQKLHVLVNNAGAVFFSRQVTAEGHELTFALNHLNYFLLTNLLLDVLKASAPARIVNVSSGAHSGARLNFDDLETTKGYNAMRVYGRSKLANIVFTYELARRLESTGVTANVLHPGFVRSGFARNNGGVINAAMGIIGRLALSPEQGAQTSIYLASSPEVEWVTGKYFVKKQPTRSNAASYEQSTWTHLWEISEQMTMAPAKG